MICFKAKILSKKLVHSSKHFMQQHFLTCTWSTSCPVMDSFCLPLPNYFHCTTHTLSSYSVSTIFPIHISNTHHVFIQNRRTSPTSNNLIVAPLALHQNRIIDISMQQQLSAWQEERISPLLKHQWLPSQLPWCSSSDTSLFCCKSLVLQKLVSVTSMLQKMVSLYCSTPSVLVVLCQIMPLSKLQRFLCAVHCKFVNNLWTAICE